MSPVPGRRRRLRRSAALVLLAGLLAGCASIPVSSDVNEGNADVQPVEPLQPIPEGPNPTDNPTSIVTGFLSASGGGVATNFDVAREFLTDEAAATWDPGAQTVVYRAGSVTPDWDERRGVVSYELPLASTIDDSGRRAEAAHDTIRPLEFSVEQNEQGYWRISELEDGVVVSQENFTVFFRPVELVFATSDRTTVVPEVRWLPKANVVTAAAQELIRGPSSWLADAVQTGFPTTSGLAVESVVVSEGLATVDLSPQSAGSQEDRALAAEQMRLTLQSLPDVAEVEVRIGGLPMTGISRLTLDPAPVPDEQAVVVMAGRLGTWDGEELLVTGDNVGGVGEAAYGLARNYDGTQVAYIDDTTLMLTSVIGDPNTQMIEPQPDLEPPPTRLPATPILEGTALVSPSFDRLGYLWTVESVTDEGMLAVSPEGEVLVFASEWLRARSTVALAVSRDGSLMAVLSRSGGQPVVEVASIHRDENGVPMGLGTPFPVGTGVVGGSDIAWADNTTLAVLGEADEQTPVPLWLITVGGGTQEVSTQPQVTSLAVRTGSASIVLIGDEGQVSERAGPAWTEVITGVSELAFAG